MRLFHEWVIGLAHLCFGGEYRPLHSLQLFRKKLFVTADHPVAGKQRIILYSKMSDGIEVEQIIETKPKKVSEKKCDSLI